MRIVAGELGGRPIRAPRGDGTRPTSEKVREALFSILGPPAADDLVLDLFAGSGGLGLEALSRGAAHVTFVDSARHALATLRDNIASLGVADRATVVARDAIEVLPTLAPPRPWRWVFLDPPYASDLAARALATLPRATLDERTRIVIEHDRRGTPPERAGSLLRTDLRRYGDTSLSFYRTQSESRP